MKKISFVILTWNSAEYVENCLVSVLGLSSCSVYVHVFDNGSTDGTLAFLEAFCEASDGRMTVTHVGENLGTTISRNVALRVLPSDTDYVCILDSDTIVNDCAIKTMVDTLEHDHTIGLIGPSMKTASGAAQLSGRNLPTVGIKLRKVIPFGNFAKAGAEMEVPVTPVVDGLQDVPYLLSACWMMPKRVLDEVGLLDERIFYAPEDVDYCVRVHNAGYRVVFCAQAEIIHEYQRISHKRLISKMNVEHVKGLAYYFRKYGYLFDSSKAYKEGDSLEDFLRKSAV